MQDLTIATAQTRLPTAPDTVLSTYTNHSLNIERDTIERICIDEFEQECVHCLYVLVTCIENTLATDAIQDR